MPIRLKSKTTSYLVNFFVDFLLLMGPLLVIYCIKYGTFRLDQNIQKFIPVYIVSWLIPTIIGEKFRFVINKEQKFAEHLNPYIKSFLIQLGLLSIILYALKWYFLSRFIILGSLGSFFLLEILLLSGSYFIPSKKEKKSKKSILLFFSELLILTLAFFGIYYQKHASFLISYDYKSVIILIYFVWAFTGLFIHHFKIEKNGNYLKTVWPFVKSFLIEVAILAFFAFNFREFEYSRAVLFGSITTLAVYDLIFASFYYLFSKSNAADIPRIEIFKATSVPETVSKREAPKKEFKGKYFVKNGKLKITGIRKKLLHVYFKDFPSVFTFLDQYLDLDKFDVFNSEIIHSANPYNVEVLPNEHFTLFVNLHEINDLRRINRYFMEVHKKLKWGGVYVGKFETYSKRHERIFNKYPYYLAAFVYFFDFIWKRIFPKMPLLKKIYFAFTKGRSRVLSKAEGLGRLYYCGFEVLAVEEIGNFVYFIATKSKEPSMDENPSYGPLFKMKRYGRNGQIIYVYKFRTMHPYSEYLQHYILEHYGYSEIGKPANDFRVTTWGKILRKLWLDELPQLLNVIKGDMKLVGVRPVSGRFLKEYPEDVLKMRFKYKPGCVPPYVALKKQAVEEYIESEKIYLQEKEKNPWTTDIKYFFWAIYNIATNKIRSA